MARRPVGVVGPFVGRARELAAIAKMVADHDQAGVVLIGGEAGLGKTRLVEEIIDANPGSAVVRGGAMPGGTPAPFELVRSAVESSFATWNEPADTATPVVEQIRITAERLRALHDGATIFVFDDVHWADPESLEVIDRLTAAGPMHSTILVTYRPEALRPDHPVSTFLQRAERRAAVLQVRLEPLRRDEVGEYLRAVRGDVGERTIDRVHGRTGGNPLFLSELVGSGAGDADLVEGLPFTLSEILRPEIERLPAPDRTVAEVVAVLGAGAEFDLVAAAASLDEDQLLERLRSLVDTGVLVESGPDRFGYRHELVREAVVDGLFTRERRRIHASAFDALTSAGSDDAHALIRHAEGAGRLDEAARIARDAAAGALSKGSSMQAFALAEEALLVYTDDAELLQIAVTAGWLSQQYRTALDHLGSWDELVGAEPRSRAEVLHWRVRLLWELGDRDGADVAAEELRQVAEHLDDAARAQAFADLAQHLMLSGEFEEAVAVAERAIDLAGTVDAEGVRLQARAERASALLNRPGGRDAGTDELMQVAADAELAGEFVVASRALHNFPLRAAPDQRRHLERMRAASQRAGMTCIGTVGYRRALLDLARSDGDREEFAVVLETAMADLEADDYVLTMAAMHALNDGRFDDARGHVERIGPPRGYARTKAVQRDGLASLIELLETGEPAGVAAWLTTAPLTDLKVDLLLENLTPILDAGLEEQVAAALSADPATCCWTSIIDALSAELAGDLDAADAAYADILHSSDGQSTLALAEVEVGRARIARRQGRDEQEHLTAAAGRLARWPGLLADRLASCLTSPRRDDSDPTRLTPREREVAQLVSEGLTNGGIADELFISTKTASVHVSNILSKLAMSSRVEVAAWVASGGLAGR